MPTDPELADYAPVSTQAKKKILGLNAARLYDIKVPAELDLPVPAGPEGAQPLAAPASI
jgi:hypothetical protein